MKQELFSNSVQRLKIKDILINFRTFFEKYEQFYQIKNIFRTLKYSKKEKGTGENKQQNEKRRWTFFKFVSISKKIEHFLKLANKIRNRHILENCNNIWNRNNFLNYRTKLKNTNIFLKFVTEFLKRNIFTNYWTKFENMNIFWILWTKFENYKYFELVNKI